MDPMITPFEPASIGPDTNAALAPRAQQPSKHALIAAGALFVVVAVALITWAKWYPYAGKVGTLFDTHAWSGSSMLAVGHVSATSAPSWHSAWSFTVAYGEDIWVALVAAILIAATMEALIPRQHIASFLTRRSTMGGTLVASLIAVPAMMCTCCSAPLTVTLKRNGVPTASTLAFWLGNPVLNPAVLVFLALVAPWQWVMARAVVGVALVLAVPFLVDRFSRSTTSADRATQPVPPVADDGFDYRGAPQRFATAIGRLFLTLVPEYFAVVMLIGAFRGWLLPLGASSVHWGALAVLVAAIAGVLIVIPTAGEIPILFGLAAVGTSWAVLGALLITLPAISLPSMSMVGRTLTVRVVAMTAGLVALFGLAGGALLYLVR